MNWIVNPMVTRSIVGHHTTWGSVNVRKKFPTFVLFLWTQLMCQMDANVMFDAKWAHQFNFDNL
jgi:hypothetical protein